MAAMLDRTLSTAEMSEVFGDAALLQAMLDVEAALAAAGADEGVIPAAAAAAIAAACTAPGFDVDAIVAEARSAGSLVIPLVGHLRRRVAAADPDAAGFVHRGSTSQDILDTAMVLATRRALALVMADLDRLIDALLPLAERHLATPMLARTLLQPAQVISFGLKVVAWAAPLVRGRKRLRRAADEALLLQFGGAVGTLSALGSHADGVGRRLAERLGIGRPEGAWHTQRDRWASLGCALAVLCGSLGKMGGDLALLAQGEVREVTEAAGAGRGGSSAMPNKRNPVAAMTAIAAATRAPHHAAALLAAMGQAHERGLGDWQAELAEWPALWLAAHGAVRALADACPGLEVDAARMRSHIEAERGTVFAEAAADLLASAIGRPAAHDLVGRLSREAVLQSGARGDLRERLLDEAAADPALHAVDAAALAAVFDIDAAAAHAGAVARTQLEALRRDGDRR